MPVMISDLVGYYSDLVEISRHWLQLFLAIAFILALLTIAFIAVCSV